MTGFAGRPGTDVEPACSIRTAFAAERGADPLLLALVEKRPARVVLHELDRPVEWLDLTDRDPCQLLVVPRRVRRIALAHRARV